MEIQLPRFNYRLGEVVEGSLALSLKEPVKAKGVKVRLTAVRTQGMSVSASPASRSSIQTLFDVEQELDGEKEYPATPAPLVYPFRFQLPATLGPKLPQLGGVAGALVGVAAGFSAMTSSTRWTLSARLDIPMGFDVSKTLQLNIVE